MREAGVAHVNTGQNHRFIPIRHDRQHYRERWQIEATIGQLKDSHRVSSRYNKLARTFLDAITRAAIYAL